MAEMDIGDGVLVGALGGAAAGLALSAVAWLRSTFSDHCDRRRIYRWLQKNTSNEPGEQCASTDTIASCNNLTEDRTRYLCSIDPRIFQWLGPKGMVSEAVSRASLERWSIYCRGK